MARDDSMTIAWHVTLSRDSVDRMDDPEPLWQVMAAYADRVAGVATDVKLRFVEAAASAMHYPFVSVLNAAILGEDLRRAERDGVDAVLIAAAGEPGLPELKTVVSIPVVGSVEAGLATSVYVGSRVGILTINPGYADIMRRNALRYGLGERLIHTPVQEFGMTWPVVEQALAGNPDELLAGFDTAFGRLVDDGADVVVGAAQIFGAVLDHVGYRPSRAPFIDGAAAGIKAAESLVHLGRTLGLEVTSTESSALRSVPDEAVEQGYDALRRFLRA